MWTNGSEAEACCEGDIPNLHIEAMQAMKTRTYSILCYYTRMVNIFSIANMVTSDWGRFKGPPSASEQTFGSARRSNAVKNQS